MNCAPEGEGDTSVSCEEREIHHYSKFSADRWIVFMFSYYPQNFHRRSSFIYTTHSLCRSTFFSRYARLRFCLYYPTHLWSAYTNIRTPCLAPFQHKYQWYSHPGRKSWLKVDVEVNVQINADIAQLDTRKLMVL